LDLIDNIVTNVLLILTVKKIENWSIFDFYKTYKKCAISVICQSIRRPFYPPHTRTTLIVAYFQFSLSIKPYSLEGNSVKSLKKMILFHEINLFSVCATLMLTRVKRQVMAIRMAYDCRPKSLRAGCMPALSVTLSAVAAAVCCLWCYIDSR